MSDVNSSAKETFTFRPIDIVRPFERLCQQHLNRLNDIFDNNRTAVLAQRSELATAARDANALRASQQDNDRTGQQLKADLMQARLEADR